MKIKNVILFTLSFMILLSTYVLPISAQDDPINKENYQPEVKTVTLDFDYIEEGTPIVLDYDSETGAKTEIIFERKELVLSSFRSSGSTGWSGGYPPSDYIWTATVKRTDIGVSMSYKVDVDGPNGQKILDAYALTYSVLAYEVRSPLLKVVRTQATSTQNAKVSFTFDAWLAIYGIPFHSFYGYIDFEINSDERVRISWSI